MSGRRGALIADLGNLVDELEEFEIHRLLSGLMEALSLGRGLSDADLARLCERALGWSQ